MADPGWKLVVADAAQLEPRILAGLSRDERMAAAGRGRDLYDGLVASGIVDTRQHAKVGMLAAMYGGTTGDGARVLPRLARAFPRAVALVSEAAATGERGEHDTIVNAPLSAGDGGDTFREAFETSILPRLRDFRPDILIISAGFDAHTRDPLANINLVEADFTWVTRKLMEIADTSAQGRIVSLLEGGYDLQGLARSAAAHVTALMHG